MKSTKEIAEIILKNSTNIYVKDMLLSYKNGSLNSSMGGTYDKDTMDNLTLVFQKIAEDGYDISEFGFWENPAEGVYCFGSHISELDGSDEAVAKAQWFDVYLDWEEIGETVIGYVGGGGLNKAENIAEAISKYEGM